MAVWFITGASRGFGRHLVDAALAADDQVVAAVRDTDPLASELGRRDALRVVPLDVTDPAQAQHAVRAALEAFGRIDVLVNNAGYGVFGSIEEVPDAEVRAAFDTNVHGLLTVTRAVLPTLRAQRSGHIVNLGSSAGFAASAGRGIYGATKFAVESISEALHDELTPLGVHVTVVEPGSFRTGFLRPTSRRRAEVGIADYEPTVGGLLTAIEANDGHQPGDPLRAAAAIRAVVADPHPPLRIQLGSDSIALVERKLASVAAELEDWRSLALSTDHDAASTPPQRSEGREPEFTATPGYGTVQRDEMHYSQAVRIGNRIETSGQGGWSDDFRLPDDLSDEIFTAFENLGRTLATAGADWADVVAIESYHVPTEGDAIGRAHNEVMVEQLRSRMGRRRPIWTQLGVASLGAPGMRVEIRATAVVQP